MLRRKTQVASRIIKRSEPRDQSGGASPEQGWLRRDDTKSARRAAFLVAESLATTMEVEMIAARSATE